MCNKHFCVLSWSGHDIPKPRVVPALLLQRQIVHEEFPGEAPNILSPVSGPGSLPSLGFCPQLSPGEILAKSCLRHQISSAIGFHREPLQQLRVTWRNLEQWVGAPPWQPGVKTEWVKLKRIQIRSAFTTLTSNRWIPSNKFMVFAGWKTLFLSVVPAKLRIGGLVINLLQSELGRLKGKSFHLMKMRIFTFWGHVV